MSPTVESDLLVSSAWLAENLDNPDIRIVEVSDMRNPRAYFEEGHLPNAVFWDWQETLWHPTSRDFLTPEAFARLMKKSGITPETTIVFYSHYIQFASYGFWVSAMRGHIKAKLLNGNRALWNNEKRPLVQEVPRFKSTAYPVQPVDEKSRMGRRDVLAGLTRPDRVILDLRTPEEYSGQRSSPDIPMFKVDSGAYRKGHIPGAKHMFWEEFFNPDKTFKPLADLRQALARRGATPDKDVICYCRLGHRGSMGWFVTNKLLNFPRVWVYDGSWVEWGNIVGYPIENESLKQ
jgi:thiosulfate/3-mercaptopyruvate sulfurtransferase